MKPFLLLLLLLMSMQQAGLCQKKSGFTLTGHIKGLQDSSKLYLITLERDTVAKCFSNKENFVFKGKLPLEGRIHFIQIDTFITSVSVGPIVVTNNQLQIVGTIGVKTPEVSGSLFQADLLEWQKIAAEYKEKKQKNFLAQEEFQKSNMPVLDGKDPTKDSLLMEAFNKKIEAMQKESIALEQSIPFALKKWVANHKSSIVAPFFIRNYAQDDFAVDVMEEAYNLLSSAAQASYYGVEAKKTIELAKVSRLVREGAVMPDFSVTSLKGSKVSIRKLIAGNKYTLLDFWASWCSPCRSAIPGLKELFTLYKKQGFNIIGISTDKKEKEWKEAVISDATPWTQVLDADKVDARMFKLTAVPAYALVDSSGKLLAFEGISVIRNFGGGFSEGKLRAQLEKLFNNEKKN